MKLSDAINALQQLEKVSPHTEVGITILDMVNFIPPKVGKKPSAKDGTKAPENMQEAVAAKKKIAELSTQERGKLAIDTIRKLHKKGLNELEVNNVLVKELGFTTEQATVGLSKVSAKYKLKWPEWNPE